MKLSNPDDRNQAAANYVLGLLSPQENVEFEALLAVSHETQKEVEDWRSHLDSLNDSLPPIVPPRRIWKNIEKAVRPPESIWSSLRLWQGTAFASIAALFMLVLVNVQQPDTQAMDYVYIVDNQQQNPGWIVNASLNNNKLYMETVQPDAFPEGKVCELWLAVEGLEPISLGFLPKSGIRGIAIPEGWKEKLAKAKLIVSLEDMAGAPSGWQMGPVLDKGDWSTRTY
ncbi:MAG: anti-sigma factor [Endozoicomonas sp.]